MPGLRQDSTHITVNCRDRVELFVTLMAYQTLKQSQHLSQRFKMRL